MKKRVIYLILFMLLVIPGVTYANEKKEVEFKSCIDGDTARFIMDKEEIKVRFLAIDTPETNHPKKGEEPYGKEAKEFTCNRITNASKIELEFDDNSDKKDKYNRYLAWVYVDDSLLEEELVQNGLAKVAYLYGDYSYTDKLKETEEEAKENKVGMYSDVDNSYYTTNKNNEKIIMKIIDTKMIKSDDEESEIKTYFVEKGEFAYLTDYNKVPIKTEKCKIDG